MTARKRTTAALAALCVLAAAGTAAAQDMPGKGKTVRPAKATWDTGWFQTTVYVEGLKALGYEVQEPTALDNPIFYQAVAQGDVDFWTDGWFPLHNTYESTFKSGAEAVGYVARGGALQGYLVDKKTADAQGIKSVEDFKRPEIKKLFDGDGDGKADMVACPPGWGCELVIEHQLKAYGLEEHVNPIKAAYSASMGDAVGRQQQGQPIFFYTWTPNWTVGLLKPGTDVVWIGTPFPSLPADQKQFESATTVPGVPGCVADPCPMGWPANDIRVVANTEFLKANPAARKLFELVSVPLDDVFAQNARMYKGEDKPADITRHAQEWMTANRAQMDGWLAEARKAGG